MYMLHIGYNMDVSVDVQCAYDYDERVYMSVCIVFL